ncbi:MAG: hypothetical protein ACOC1X_00260 [Promethearchaeota archaeon]
MKKNLQKKVVLFALLALFVANLSMTFMNVRAGYTNNIEIDCELDAEYTYLTSSDNYTMYYTNNDSHVFIYANFSFTLENETILLKSKDITENLTLSPTRTNNTYSKHIGKVLEFEVIKSIGEQFVLEISEELSLNIILMSLFEEPEPLEPPEDFELFTEDYNDPDPDGSFKLKWIQSIDARSYTIYTHNETFDIIHENLTKITDLNYDTLEYDISSLTNGTYYYAVSATNSDGTTLSNVIEITVEIIPEAPVPKPGSFLAFSDAGNPDTDGKFNLTWTPASGANYYNIFMGNNPITEDNLDNAVKIAENIQPTDGEMRFEITETNGSYFYSIVAYNEGGYSISNYVYVRVNIRPPEIEISAWGWAFGLIVETIFFILIAILWNASQKEYVKAYEQERIITKDDQRYSKTQLSGLKKIGEFCGSERNWDRLCYEFLFRKGRKYYKIFSLIPYEEYKLNHFVDHYNVIRYSLAAQVFHKKVEPYEQELGWTKQAYLYKLLSLFFNLSPTGFVFSILIMGTIFVLSFPGFAPAFLIGAAVGLGVSTINYCLRKYTSIKETFLKQKTETTDVETYMAPLESDVQVLDVYQVKGTRIIKTKTEDGTEKKVVEKLRDNEKVDYLTVVGYDKLIQLKEDKAVEIKSFKIIDVEKRKRTSAEQRASMRTYLSRNRDLVERIFDLQKQVARLQKKHKKAIQDLHQVEEEKDKEVTDLYNDMAQMREKIRNGLKEYFAQSWGSEFVEKNFDKAVKDAYEIIQNAINSEVSSFRKAVLGNQKRIIEIMVEKLNVEEKEMKSLYESIAGEFNIGATS